MYSADDGGTCPVLLRILVASSNKETVAKIRQSINECNGVQYVGVAADGIEAAQLTAVAQPDVVVVDDRLDGDGLHVCNVISQIAPKTKCALLVEGLNEDTIARAARAGAREVLKHTFEPREFATAIGRMTDAEKERIGREYEWATNPQAFPRLLVVTSAKGGTGTTSLAVNLAVALAASNTGRAVLVDGASAFRDSAAMLNVWPRYGLADIADGFQDVDTFYQDQVLLENCMTQAAANLNLLVCAGAELTSPMPPPAVVARAIVALKRGSRYIVLDAPHSLLTGRELGVHSFWRLLLLANLRDISLVQNTRRLLDALGCSYQLEGNVGIVLDRDARAAEFSASQIEEAIKVPVVATIPEDPSLIRACNLGRPVVLETPKAPSARAIVQLSEALIVAAGVASTGGRFFATT